MPENEKYIERCFQLAQQGLGNVAPNPLVGCVIVHNQKIIGEGFHQIFGGPHAEVNAINRVHDKTLLKDSTLYVNLEPCAHFGKTPPCADLILKYQIPKVVVSNYDPFPEVAGKGISRLKQNGVEVIMGVLENQGKFLNRRFFTWVTKKRPYIILKWAQSADGFVGTGKRTKITNQRFDIENHLWRTQEAAIMVGTKTVETDNPILTSRLIAGNQPTRIIVDKYLRLKNDLNVFNGNAPTVIINQLKEEVIGNLIYKKVHSSRVEDYMQVLLQLNLQSVIIEGGPALLTSFIQNNLFDEIRVAIGNCFLVSGTKAPTVNLQPAEAIDFGDDKLFIFYNPQTKLW